MIIKKICNSSNFKFEDYNIVLNNKKDNTIKFILKTQRRLFLKNNKVIKSQLQHNQKLDNERSLKSQNKG